jgi:hypothetical protein
VLSFEQKRQKLLQLDDWAGLSAFTAASTSPHPSIQSGSIYGYGGKDVVSLPKVCRSSHPRATLAFSKGSEADKTCLFGSTRVALATTAVSNYFQGLRIVISTQELGPSSFGSAFSATACLFSSSCRPGVQRIPARRPSIPFE